MIDKENAKIKQCRLFFYFQLDKDNVEVGEEFKVTISFTNPVKVKLTGVDVDLEGPGIVKTKDVKVA